MVKGKFVRIASSDPNDVEFTHIDYEQSCSLYIRENFINTALGKRSTGKQLQSRSWSIRFDALMSINRFKIFAKEIVNRTIKMWSMQYDLDVIEGLGFMTKLRAVADKDGMIKISGEVQGTGELKYVNIASSEVDYLIDYEEKYIIDNENKYLVCQISN